MFNMAVMGLRLAQRANGVSRLHGVVSREMFDGLWPGFDDAEVPITSITNGVHGPTWVDRQVFELARTPTPTSTSSTPRTPGRPMAHVPRARGDQARAALPARRRRAAAPASRGSSGGVRGGARLDRRHPRPDVLTIGFARRVPTYKRLTLMLRDPARLKLLLDPDRPVQLVIAGKAHPADETGKQLIQQMVRFADDPEVRHRIVFLPNYDIAMALHLYPGLRRLAQQPAAALRGLRHVRHEGSAQRRAQPLHPRRLVGRVVRRQERLGDPDRRRVEDPERRDDIEANALYDLIENQVAPRFYDTDELDLPQNWLAMLLHTVTTLGPKVRASRMVRDYTQQLYVPAARSGWAMAEGGYAGARDLAAYKAQARDAWGDVHVDHVESSGVGDSPELGETLHVTAYVSLGDLGPDDVDVQVAHGRTNHHGDELHDVSSVSLGHVESYEHGRHQFAGDLVLRASGAFGYTVRVLPRHPGLATTAELGLVANA